MMWKLGHTPPPATHVPPDTAGSGHNGDMSTIFQRIIAGELPGRFVYADDLAVAIATIEPVTPGHVLVIPRHPYPAWTDMPEDEWQHLSAVARTIGRAQLEAFECQRIGFVIAGYEVPHTHIHVYPTSSEKDITRPHPEPVSDRILESTMSALRAALEAQGCENVPLTIDSPDLD